MIKSVYDAVLACEQIFIKERVYTFDECYRDLDGQVWYVFSSGKSTLSLLPDDKVKAIAKPKYKKVKIRTINIDDGFIYDGEIFTVISKNKRGHITAVCTEEEKAYLFVSDNDVIVRC